MKDYFKNDDNQLIALLREDNPIKNEAFNVLYYRYAERLKSYCLFKTDNKEDAKELHQETWIKFLSIVDSEKKNITLPAILYTIARTISIDKYRLKNKHLVIYSDYFDYENIADSFDLHTKIENRDLLTLISVSLNELPEIYRESFILRWFAGLTFREISMIVGETEDCIKKRCLRAMDDILKILQPFIVEVKEY